MVEVHGKVDYIQKVRAKIHVFGGLSATLFGWGLGCAKLLSENRRVVDVHANVDYALKTFV